jgi:ribosome-associated protein
VNTVNTINTTTKQELTSNIIDTTNPNKIKNLSSESAKLAVKEAENLKGVDLTLLDVREITSISEYVLIITGTSSTHCKAIAENIRVEAKKHKLDVLGFESDPQSEWILIDLDDTVIHVMQKEAREYYALEKLWQVVIDKASKNRD